MKPDILEERMRALEWYHSLTFPMGSWVILRLDGRSFSRLTEAQFEKPFDERFHQLMSTTARGLLEELQASYVYTESDEISVLLPRNFDLFDRELEKTLSISASIAAATFSLAHGQPAQFDARACLASLDDQVVDYFRWRQADATRCALNGWCYWTLRKQGLSPAQATSTLEGKGTDFKNELLFQAGINFNQLPLWQRRGTGMYWQEVPHEGYNPVLKQNVLTTRRRVVENRELPLSDQYAGFLRERMREEG
jgi:tRNA(His) 5'-end guanylyltransferase